MRALSIRQPWAEDPFDILRAGSAGGQDGEYRSRLTRVIGERFHIYAPLKHAQAECEGLVAGGREVNHGGHGGHGGEAEGGETKIPQITQIQRPSIRPVF
jgi:hypothetical protein